MRKILLFIALSIFKTEAQIGINTNDPKVTLEIIGTPDESKILDGLLAPKLTGDQLKLKKYHKAQEGTLVYITSADPNPSGQTIDVKTPGYYYFNGSIWVKFNKPEINTKNNAFWGINGNENINSEDFFLGTKDKNPLIIKTNNIERIRINENGNIGIGDSIKVPERIIDINASSNPIRVRNLPISVSDYKYSLTIDKSGDISYTPLEYTIRISLNSNETKTFVDPLQLNSTFLTIKSNNICNVNMVTSFIFNQENISILGAAGGALVHQLIIIYKTKLFEK